MVDIFKVFLVAVVLAFSAYASDACSANNAWLVGKWELAHDPDGSPMDWVEFTADGKTVSISDKGARVPGKYTLPGKNVRAVYSLNGKTITVNYTVSSDKKKLLYYSKKTGSTAEYKKLP